MSADFPNPSKSQRRQRWGLAILGALTVLSAVLFFSSNTEESTLFRSAKQKAVEQIPDSSPASPFALSEDKQAIFNEEGAVAIASASPAVRLSSATAAQPSRNQLSSQIPKAQREEFPSDKIEIEPAVAVVRVDGKPITLEPNSLGSFPRIRIAAEGTASITVSYSKGTVSEPLMIQCEDGGTLDNRTVVQSGTLDVSKGVSFEFKAGSQEGVYRITLRKGWDEKQLVFWVGPDIPFKPMAVRN